MTKTAKFAAHAKTLMDFHGLNEWSYNTHNMKKVKGTCDHGIKCIFLSKAYIEVWELVEAEQTILHEIAHALVGPGHGHNEVWKAKAREIGCINPKAKTRGARPVGRWNLVCTGCNKTVIKGRHRRSNMKNKRHKDCVAGSALLWKTI